MTGTSPVESIADGVRSARLRALARYWVEKSAGLAMPFRRQIEPVEIPGILPIVLLADITQAGARMRLLGSEATSAYGSETRGCSIADIRFGEFTAQWQDAFSRVIRSASPVFAAGTYRRGHELCGVETVLMPLTEDSLSVSQIFGGLLIRPVVNDRMIDRRAAIGPITPIAGKTADGTGRRVDRR
jgi:hypothetical protein